MWVRDALRKQVNSANTYSFWKWCAEGQSCLMLNELTTRETRDENAACMKHRCPTFFSIWGIASILRHHWLPVKYCIELKTLLIVFKGLHGVTARSDDPISKGKMLHDIRWGMCSNVPEFVNILVFYLEMIYWRNDVYLNIIKLHLYIWL